MKVAGTSDGCKQSVGSIALAIPVRGVLATLANPPLVPAVGKIDKGMQMVHMIWVIGCETGR